MRRSRWFLVAVVSVATMAATTTTSTAQTEDPRPGVYVDEIPSFGDSFVGVATGIPVFVGIATATGAPGTSPLVDSVAAFDEAFTDPSPAMAAAVADFYAVASGSVVISPTSSETPEALAAASAAVPRDDGWDLIVVPALADLDGEDWLAVASAMTAAAAGNQAVAVLDPPTAAVASAATDAGAALTAAADQLRAGPSGAGSAVMYSSGLTDATGATRAGAPSVAAVIAATDDATGPWQPAGGTATPIPDSTPTLSVDNALAGTLADSGINSLRTVQGYGTVAMGDRTVGGGPSSVQRLMSYLELSIRTGLEQYVFDPNVATTWQDVTATTSNFLAQVWAAGGLAGDSPADSFTVQVGLGTTMTDQDILNGIMILLVQVAVEQPGQFVALSIDQLMQG